MEMKRTTGVKVFACIITLILACQFLMVFYYPDYMLPQNRNYFLENCFKTLFLIAISILIPAILGIFLLRKWGRITAILAALLLSIHMVGQLVIFPYGLYYYGLSSLILCSFIDLVAPFMLFYFIRPKVKEQFKK